MEIFAWLKGSILFFDTRQNKEPRITRKNTDACIKHPLPSVKIRAIRGKSK